MVPDAGFPATLAVMRTRRTVSASRSAGLVLVALAWAGLLAFAGSPEALLFTVPVFLLTAPLAFGRYVGEEAITAFRLPSRQPRREVPTLELDALQLFPGSLLAAFRLSARGPPAVAS